MWRPPAFDTATVLLFVIIGRETHEEGNAVVATLETATPFLIALAVGWAAAQVWLGPDSLLRGMVVLGATVVLGMLMRRLVFDDGTAPTFIAVSAAFLGLGMLGWRTLVGRSRSQVRRG